MDVGARISELRKNKNLTLAELGHMVGVGASTVRKWETGFIEHMRSDKIEKLAIALDTTPAYIMGWDDKLNQNANENDLSFNHIEIPQSIKLTEVDVDMLIKETYGADCFGILNLYTQLDVDDRAEIRVEMKHMLKSDKYSIKKGYKNA